MEHNEKAYMVKVQTINGKYAPLGAQHILYTLDEALELGVAQSALGNDVEVLHFAQDTVVAKIGGVYREQTLPCQGKPMAPLACEEEDDDPNDAAAA